MRIILFLLLVVCFGASSQAQENSLVSKVQPFTMPIALTLELSEFPTQKFQTAASFFKVRHGSVKRALLFKPNTKKTQVA